DLRSKDWWSEGSCRLVTLERCCPSRTLPTPSTWRPGPWPKGGRCARSRKRLERGPANSLPPRPRFGRSVPSRSSSWNSVYASNWDRGWTSSTGTRRARWRSASGRSRIWSGSTGASSPDGRFGTLEEAFDPLDYGHGCLFVQAVRFHHHGGGARVLQHGRGPAVVAAIQASGDGGSQQSTHFAASVVGREVIHRRFAPGQAEGHHQLCPQSVGSKSPYALGEDHVVAARQQGNASPFLEGDRRRVGSRPGQGRLVGVPASGVEIDACPDDGRGSGAKPLQLAHRLPAGPHGCSGDEPQFGDDLGACFSIFCQVTVALEVEDGALGVGPEDTVDLPRVEAQVVEPALEFGNVVASQHRA